MFYKVNAPHISGFILALCNKKKQIIDIFCNFNQYYVPRGEINWFLRGVKSLFF